jgi:hypothetical protein
VRPGAIARADGVSPVGSVSMVGAGCFSIGTEMSTGGWRVSIGSVSRKGQS